MGPSFLGFKPFARVYVVPFHSISILETCKLWHLAVVYVQEQGLSAFPSAGFSLPSPLDGPCIPIYFLETSMLRKQKAVANK